MAWWGTGVPVPGPAHPVDDGWVLLEVGDATMLRNRVTRQDLYRTGVSTLRRTLAGLLLDDLGLAPTWAAEVDPAPRRRGPADGVDARAPAAVSVTLREDRKLLLGPVRDAMAPGLRDDREPALSALARFDAAGRRAPRPRPLGPVPPPLAT